MEHSAHTPAFVLELEIDDEISFKPLKNKRALQTLDCNSMPLSTPEKRKQIQKLSTPASTSASSYTPSAEMDTPVATVDDQTPLLMYSNQLENDHKPKYSQAELDAQKLEWQKESDHQMHEAREHVRSEGAAEVQRLETQSSSLRQDKSILERQVAALQATLFENRSDENSQVDNQVKILSGQLSDAKSQHELLQKQHEEEIVALKNSNDKRISEMIKSHATSILAMQERVISDMTATWQQKLTEEQAVSSDLRNTMQALSAQVARLGEEKTQAVKDAKKKMYDKVTLQFEAGNLKYEALKNSYKESQDGLQSATAKITELKESLNVLECKLEQFSKEAAGVTAVIGSIEAACVDIIKSFSSEKLESTDLLQDAVRKSIFDKIQNEITSSAGKAAVADDTVKNLNSEIDRLKESTLVSNKTLSGINAEKEELNSTLATVRQALETCKEELASSKLEKDSQMLVIANMITEKGKADVELESASQQNQELTQRCEDLRKMNDEIMSMLEKMYDKKEES